MTTEPMGVTPLALSEFAHKTPTCEPAKTKTKPHPYFRVLQLSSRLRCGIVGSQTSSVDSRVEWVLLYYLALAGVIFTLPTVGSRNRKIRRHGR